MVFYPEIAAMNTSEYKSYHESIMQDNHGSSAIHTYFCVFFTVQCSIFSSIRANPRGAQYVNEYIFIILPLIIVHTIFSNYIYILNCLISTILLYETIMKVKSVKINKLFTTPNTFLSNRIQAISFMRGLTYLITVFCILAVDFQQFPRHLAKTEKYGFSLMDTGVGLFVLMSGLVHKDLHNRSLKNICKGNMKFISILIFLGIARFLSIKQLDYQEHVTEYGVHWNFFITLAICKLISTFILYHICHELLFSIILIFTHEFILYYSLEGWVFSNATRDSFVSANREGICSSMGYIALYLFGAHIKKVLSDKAVCRLVIQKKLIKGSVFLWILSYVIDLYRPASRTLANAGYCIYLEAMLVSVVAILYFFQVLLEDEDRKNQFQVPLILDTINNNGLTYFLVANLLTGAINLSIRTLSVPCSITFVILNVYMIVTTKCIVYLKNTGVKI